MGHFFLTTISTLTLFAMPVLPVVIDFEAQAGFYGSTTPSSEFAGIVFDRDVQVLAGTSVAARPGQSGQVARAAIPPFGGLPRGGDIGGLFGLNLAAALGFGLRDRESLPPSIIDLYPWAKISDTGTMPGAESPPNKRL